MIHRRTKIVCTIGPASRSADVVAALIEAGMNVARVNFSHGTHADHAQAMETIRAESDRLGRRVAILQDLSGPKMRTGPLAEGPVELTAGRNVVLTTRSVPGDALVVSVNGPELIESVHEGDRLLLGDGEIELEVVDATQTDLTCRVVVGGPLRARKGISAPGVALKRSVPTDKDLADLTFGLAHHVDWIAQSFVRTADEIRTLRAAIRDHGNDVPIMAKLEKREALDDLDAILDEADGVMVARGDLALEVGLKEIPAVQKRIIKHATRVGKPEITATQMLESMITNPRPTRAEVTDIANAIFDGTDAIMLSGETAIGRYPVETCRTMAEVAAAAEKHIDYVEQFKTNPTTASATVEEAVGHAACDLALRIGAALIICCTRSGRTAAVIAKYRPHAAVAVASPSETTLLSTIPLWGTHPVRTNAAETTDTMIAEAKQAVLAASLARAGSKVVIVAGPACDQSGTANIIKADVL